jgi:hypothetical protein
MAHNDLEEYKKAVKSKYEIEKNGMYSNFLLLPSRANLRNLCAERFKGNKSSDDLTAYKILCGFEYEEGNIHRLKKVTGRFRAIENFFIGKTDTNDIEAIDLAAILVDFNPRPFRKFAKTYGSDREKGDIEIEAEEKENPQNDKEKKEPEKVPVILMFHDKAKATNNDIDKAAETGDNKNKRNFFGEIWDKIKGFAKKKGVIASSVLIIIFSVCYTAKDVILPEKECMQWQDDHYELVDCQGEADSKYDTPIEILDKNAIDLRKIEVCDSTHFFCGGKATVWYCKVGNDLEYFNGPGAGFHPITKKQLNPISDYMITKYVPPCK